MRPLQRSFYARKTVTVAMELLGKTLVRRTGRGLISGTIAETEAYGSSDDPASHAFRGMTRRNRAMFGEVGRAYVYFTYGMHYCVNAVARDEESAAGAVLIRSLLPRDGINLMMENRKKHDGTGLADGPAKLTQALGISKEEYGADLTSDGRLFIADGIHGLSIQGGARVGIRHGREKAWNFRINGSPA